MVQKDQAEKAKRDRIALAIKLAAEFFERRIHEDPRAGGARAHLISRKIKPQTTVKFQIGFAPFTPGSSLANYLLTEHRFTPDELISAGLAARSRPQNTTTPFAKVSCS